MQGIELTTVFDPEILLPSKESVHNLAFWHRLLEWTVDPRPRVGAMTFERLHELYLDPPEVKGLPKAELWTIYSKLAARAAIKKPPIPHQICIHHLTDSYIPLYGPINNAEPLVDAIDCISNGGAIVVATDRRCWPKELDSECSKCDICKISLLTEPKGDLSAVWRTQYRLFGNFDLAVLIDMSDRMFPNLKFSKSAWNYMHKLKGDPAITSGKLMTHLSVLNDEASRIWSQNSTTADRKAQLGSLGIDASPENSNTHKSSSAMKARMFSFEEKTLVCEWHTKFERHRNRIYFAVENDNVYIGVVTDHL
ncbi:Uncharacterised protein [Mycobacteroides abscessus subsp. massiliense]|nr:Uncharacterised protein [Mycobacteroides abscessus subsp. massiliense]SKT54132.1 Uncharacterised protein [Mycobacteroides abscessus subsp. massiliense]